MQRQSRIWPAGFVGKTVSNDETHSKAGKNQESESIEARGLRILIREVKPDKNCY